MALLEELTPGATVRGLLPNGLVTVVNVTWYGDNALELTYKDASGQVNNQILYRDDEHSLELVEVGQPWSFDADGELLRLVSEAQRIRWAHLFDPYLAVHTSLIQPLPHQITAVYGEMLPRQPLRFLLADDPGAGKTIMTGLLIKELLIRGALKRCLIVAPGNLVEQWQDELYRRFNLPFELLTNDRIASARSGNVFHEMPLAIGRLDKMARDDALQEKLRQSDWDLIVCDEAHKMSATYFGREVKYTKRYHLGQVLADLTRHFLLLTATPHNGKEADFQLFMALLDGDRFEGRFREGVHRSDTSDLMRRMVKEKLVKFDGKPLFPERYAYTVTYKLSNPEAVLYQNVTEYVREEFNRADALGNAGRKGTVGFALTILQRRLASSPAAIHQSLKRRRERLERRLREAQLQSRVATLFAEGYDLDEEAWDDLDETPAEELERLEEELVDQATAARTVEELRREIETLKRLESQALEVRNSGMDRKWEELSRLLQDNEEMFDSHGHRRKLVIFTEHRDTLSYLMERIRSLLGRAEAVVTIHGGLSRDERRHAQEAFTQDKAVQVLVATDAAGEGINLQRAHLMINYDLPWNPNRLEQRFGRIHRIGQTEVCHLWNLVAEETREGDVYLTLLRKLERERAALGGAVFDVLGQALEGRDLRRLMIEAVRYGDRADVRAKLMEAVEGALDHERLRSLMEAQALTRDMMDPSEVTQIRREMERMEARRLQPHFIASFFKKAFAHLGGTLSVREEGRYEIRHVPAIIRQRDRLIGVGDPVMRVYERICFERELINQPGKPTASFVCPGHPLLDATVDLILERYRDLMKQGAILVEDSDPGEQLRALFYLEHSIQDGRNVEDGNRRVVSRRFQFVEMPLEDEAGPVRNAGYAPYLDYRPLREEERALVEPLIEGHVATQALENRAVGFAIRELVPEHLREVKQTRLPLLDKTWAAVKERLTKEITYWDHRAQELRAQELAGKPNAKLNSARARQRADELQERLRKRQEELEQERQLAARPPAALGGALIVPGGLLARMRGEVWSSEREAKDLKRIEMAAMNAVMAAERALRFVPEDVSRKNLGYDIESLGGDEIMRLIEVKGFSASSNAVTVTRNEIMVALNKPEKWLLALVEVPGDEALSAEAIAAGRWDGCRVRYVRQPFEREPDFEATSVNYDRQKLWVKGLKADQTVG